MVNGRRLILNSLRLRSMAAQTASSAANPQKVVHFLRHGQAQHNVRAEEKRKAGCSYDEFIQQMKDDDAFDAALTDLGRSQAAACGASPACQDAQSTVQLIAASPLSRALDTADLAFPCSTTTPPPPPRVCCENLREISGYLLNGKRRPRIELRERYPQWDFSALETEEDELWSATLETDEAARERAYRAVRWAWERPEQELALVAHGGLFMLCFDHQHPGLQVVSSSTGAASKRFGNCELRTFRLALRDDGDGDDGNAAASSGDGAGAPLLRFELELIRAAGPGWELI